MAACLRLAVLLFAGAAGLAQAAPPGLGPDSAVEGVVQRYLTTPYGGVNGLRLREGRIVLFGPPMAPDVVATAPPGARVRVIGQSLPDGALRATTVVNLATGAVADDTPDRAPPPAVHAPLVQCEAAGVVETVLHGPRGDANGVILLDGTLVYFRPGLAQPGPGQPFAATGIGTANQCAMALEAIVVGADLATVRAASAAVTNFNQQISPASAPHQEPPRHVD